MPWKASDAHKHNKNVPSHLTAQWAAVANSVLEKTGDDGAAIRAANSAVKHHMSGEHRSVYAAHHHNERTRKV